MRNRGKRTDKAGEAMYRPVRRVGRLAASAVAAAGLIAALTAAPAGAQTEIFGGTPASTGAYPFMVSLQDMTITSGTAQQRHICGGTLIRGNVVLTAAHCVFNTTRDNAQSLPGDIDLIIGRSRLNDGTQGQVRNAAAIVRHPEYDGDVHHGADVALIRLDVAATVAPIRFPNAPERTLWEAGDTARLIGWGATETLTTSDLLEEVFLPVQSDAAMTAAYGTDYASAEMIGAGSGNGFGQCSGDSGGPLFLRTPTAIFQFGVVSFSDKSGGGCATAPGVFARVGEGKLRTWIETMVSVPSFTVSDPTTPEAYRCGDPDVCFKPSIVSASATFQIRLSHPTIQPVSVRFTTANGTAVAPADYTAKSVTINLAAGGSLTNVSVGIVRDSVTEGDEFFTGNLSSAVNATIADGQGRATIHNGIEDL